MSEQSEINEPFDPKNEAHMAQQRIDEYLQARLHDWKTHEWRDDQLWEYYQEDFEDWTPDHFARASASIRREIKEFLNSKGVFITKPRQEKLHISLYHLVQEKEYHQWTKEEIDHQMARKGHFDSYWNPNDEKHQFSQRLYPLDPDSPTPMSSRQPELEYPPIKEPPRQDTQGPPQKPHTPHTPKQLVDLMKIYNNDEHKYGGEVYEVLEYKLRIFYDYCRKVGLLEENYIDAFSIILKGRASEYYFTQLVGKGYTFLRIKERLQIHFETAEKRQLYLSEWRETTLHQVIEKNRTKTKLECLEIMLDKLQLLQRALPEIYPSEDNLREAVVNACRGIDECKLALHKPADTYEGLCADLRGAIGAATASSQTQYTYDDDEDNETANDNNQYWTDRKFNGRGRGYRGGYRSRGNSGRSNYPARENNENTFKQKKCYICGKTGCWSTKHSDEERRKAYSKYREHAQYHQQLTSVDSFTVFLADYEGSEITTSLTSTNWNDDEETEHFFTEFGSFDGNEILPLLQDHAAYHVFTRDDRYKDENSSPQLLTEEHGVYTFNDRYSDAEFQGIMPDSGASGISTAGEPQFRALQSLNPNVTLNSPKEGNNTVRFGKGTVTTKGTTIVPTPVGDVTFHIVPANTPFLMCLQDMDRLGVKFDNLKNVLTQGDKITPIVRKWGHPWMMLNITNSTAWMHLTETELRLLHRRFGHPSVQRLHRILQRSGHQTDISMIEAINKICHQCQMHSKSPGRFKFTVKDDYDFNYEIIVDVMYLNGKPVLHIVDAATSFQAARFLPDISAKTTWETLKACWIDTYLGPPDYIVHDAGRNFASMEFRQNAKAMTITVKEVPVEAHNSIGKVERYHLPIRRAFEIICDEIPDINEAFALQMAVKAINDTAAPDGIVPTLLVFGAYPRMTDNSPPSPSIYRRAEAIRKAMTEVRQLYSKRQVQEALRARNGPKTHQTLQLPLNSEVRVWREKGGWTGPYKLISVDNQDCIVEMPSGNTKFRATVVKPYHRDPIEQRNDPAPELTKVDDHTPLNEITPPQKDEEENAEDRVEDTIVVRQPGRGRPRQNQYINSTIDGAETFIFTQDNTTVEVEAFLSNKEKVDWRLSRELRRSGRITTQGEPFEASTAQEINDLIASGVFRFEKYNPNVHGRDIFRSRMVNEIKGKNTNSPYEKSRLVIQGYNDNGKQAILTQSPTIQRASQRLILALAPSLIKDYAFQMALRDITQAYTQSTTELQRLIVARLPKQIQHHYPEKTVMVVVKPLYGIAESGNHWFATYFKHHREKLRLMTSTYDPCLMISEENHPTELGIVGVQTDDTLILATEDFLTNEEKRLNEAKFRAKARETLQPETPLNFNGGVITQEGDEIILRQKGQGKRLQQINASSEQSYQTYIEQRARGAYLATICQPEAAFDLSIAAQHKEPDQGDISKLNKRLKWQIDHPDRGLTYIPLNLQDAKLFLFVDGSFANNKDLSSQLGYEIIIANETTGNDDFTIKGNLIHWSSTKSKRVTRSVLASEIYGMTAGVDMAIAMSTTLAIITQRLGIPDIHLVVCTDSYSLYECLVKLGTTKEKRLMIDIMALRQSYERKEIFEMRWINGNDNPADAMTKATPNKALENFVSTNTLRIRVEGWVDRP